MISPKQIQTFDATLKAKDTLKDTTGDRDAKEETWQQTNTAGKITGKSFNSSHHISAKEM